VQVFFRSFIVMLLVAGVASSSAARHRGKSHASPAPPPKRSDTEIENATRLQVFLDRANFSPGKIDGHYNDFTLKALALYRQSQGEPSSEVSNQPPSPEATASQGGQRSETRKAKGQKPTPTPQKPDTPPDLNGIDLQSVDPVFIQYTVTDADMKNIGPVPPGSGAQLAPEKAKLPALPYRNVGQELAEKFHCDQKFLAELNPGKNGDALRPGDQLRVPNVEPFDLDAVKNLQPGKDAANDLPDAPEQKPDPTNEPEAAAKTSVKVDVKTNMLGVFEGDKIIAAYPVSVGSKQTATPIGEWKVRGIAKLPTFRWDEQMLKHGERSKNFYLLKPGPNNPVGVVWIALNKRGIGIHGTDEPDTIGHAASHGCIRLANWDIVRLAERVKPGTEVSVK
jgi:lipoprotein-anchoring transpeptidase ErfK/SrfK